MTTVLDTNIWISLALARQLGYISFLVDSGIAIASCDQLQSELSDVLNRKKFSKYFPSEYIERVLQIHELATDHFDITTIPDIVSDPKDNYLFALCRSSNADFFITGDKLLLDVGKYNDTKILTLA